MGSCPKSSLHYTEIALCKFMLRKQYVGLLEKLAKMQEIYTIMWIVHDEIKERESKNLIPMIESQYNSCTSKRSILLDCRNTLRIGLQ